MLKRVIDRLGTALGACFTIDDPTDGHACSMAPIIGNVASNEVPIIGAAVGGAQRDSSVSTVPVVGTAPHMPMIGTQRGMAYAERFVAELVAWVAAQGLPNEWQGDLLVEVAAHRFAPAVGLVVPVERNMLTALKRMAGVSVRKHVRIYDHRGQFIGKRTLYQLPVGLAVVNAEPHIFGAVSSVQLAA